MLATARTGYVSAAELLTGSAPCALLSAMLVAPDGVGGSVEIRDGELGPVRLALKAPSGNCCYWHSKLPGGMPFTDGIHVTPAGGAVVICEYLAR